MKTGSKNSAKAEKDAKIEYLYETYKGAIMGVAMKILRNHDDAEDIAQDVFEKLLANYEKYDLSDETKVKNLLLITGRNLAINLKKQKSRLVSIEDVDPMRLVDVSKIDTLDFEDDIKVLIRTINSIEPIYRDVLLLKHINNCSVDSIAKTLNIKPKTAQKRIERGEKKLKAKLKGEDDS